MDKKVKHFVTTEKAEQHAEIFANRVKKQYKHLAKRMRKANIDAFRLPLTDFFVVKIDWLSRELSGASPPPRRDDLSNCIS